MIEFETDDRLGLGEFGIQTRVVHLDEEPVSAPAREAAPAQSGRTMVYGDAGRYAEPLGTRSAPGLGREPRPRCS